MENGWEHRKSMGFYGIYGIDLMGFYGILGDSRGFYGILWDSMGFYRFPEMRIPRARWMVDFMISHGKSDETCII